MEQKGVVKYQSKDGQEITLSADIIKKYLVQGNREAVTEQELMYFLGVCKSRGLNPFKKDAYLIKYGADPAAIVTSIDYFRSRAKAQSDCKGWKRGIIVQAKDGTVKDSAGILLEGETLIGGFFESKPAGWTDPFRIEVNLKGYIKKTKDGKITRFWQSDNQPTMISKVAEGQGLRALWPDEFQGIYEKDEIIPSSPDVEMHQGANGSFEKKEPLDTSALDKLVPADKKDAIEKYVSLIAQHSGKPADEIKVRAAGNFKEFMESFEKHEKKNTEPEDFKCPECDFVAKSDQGLKVHITRSHSDDPDETPDPDTGELTEAEQKEIMAQEVIDSIHERFSHADIRKAMDQCKEAVPGINFKSYSGAVTLQSQLDNGFEAIA